MEQEIGLVYWDNSYNSTMLLTLAIIIGLFTSLRLFSGAISHIDPSFELTQKDNAAFGISLAGVVFGVTLVLSGVIPSNWAMPLADSVVAVGVYGVVGIAMMALTRVIFDRIALPRISIRDEIVKGNVAAAIVDAGNVIAAALVIRALMAWIPSNTLDGLVSLLLVYLVSQAVLTAVAVVHVQLLSKRVEGGSLQTEIQERNSALAMRFSGRRIGVAFAISAASSIMVYEIYEVTTLLFAWVLVSLAVIAGVILLSWLAIRIILFGVDVNDEVIRQRNVALGAVQGTVYLSLGLIVASLMA